MINHYFISPGTRQILRLEQIKPGRFRYRNSTISLRELKQSGWYPCDELPPYLGRERKPSFAHPYLDIFPEEIAQLTGWQLIVE